MRSALLRERFRGDGSCVRALEVCLFFALACCSCSAASDGDRTITQFAHTAWSTKDGAPSPVTALAQSANGYLWLGTTGGLYRFDGVVFERYHPESSGPFPRGTVMSLLALPNGDLWIGFSPGAISLLSNRSASFAINSGSVPGNPLSRCVSPCQPEPSFAPIPRTPPV